MKKQILFFLLTVFATQTFVEAQSNQYLHFDRQNDHVRLDGGSQYVAPQFTALPGTWQHFAWVYNGSEVALYVDGTLHGSTPASGTFTVDDIPFTIGRSILSNLNFYYGGRVDEVSVWSKAISQTEIEDMMANELTGTEDNLELYYKFNQGDPGGDNTGITQLVSEVGGGSRDADLIGFALDGENSNFGGELQTGFQAISFSDISNKLNTAPPFQLDAEASSGLPVSFTVVSGPASVSDNTVTLDGTAGEVVQYGFPGFTGCHFRSV